MSEERTTAAGWPQALSLDEHSGPAPYITRAKTDALVLRALAQAGYDAPLAGGEAQGVVAAENTEPTLLGATPDAVNARLASSRSAANSSPPSAEFGKRRRWAASSAAAIVLLACVGMGSASAAVLWYVRERPSAPEPVVTQLPVTRAAPIKPRPAPRVQLELPPQIVESTKPKLERRAPEDWLVEGNRLRAERNWAKADAAYSNAARSAPHSQTAYVAHVASAAVRLEHLGDARGALALYRSALRDAPHGPLQEEVLFGIAESLRALGDGPGERAALERFLREHPGSPLAPAARRRLE